MQNLRKYGDAPFQLAVMHGGPGGPGYLAPLARKLSNVYGVLEPLQTANTLKGQVQELYSVLNKNASLPVVLIGHSWGAMLSLIFTSKYPMIVKKLILVASPPFEEKNIEKIMHTRMSRLYNKEQLKISSILEQLENSEIHDKNTIFAELAQLAYKADSYKLIPCKDEVIEYQYDIHKKVWNEASHLRKKSEFTKLAQKITCPVIAIHGDYDAHPGKDVQDFLFATLTDFKFYLLKKCGHYPWMEQEAKEKFYKILFKELKTN